MGALYGDEVTFFLKNGIFRKKYLYELRKTKALGSGRYLFNNNRHSHNSNGLLMFRKPSLLRQCGFSEPMAINVTQM